MQGKGKYTAEAGSYLLQYLGSCLYQRLFVVKEETEVANSRRNFMLELAIELREVHVQEKTAAVLPPLFNNSYENSMVDGSRKRKRK